MTIDLELVGRAQPVTTRVWTETDALLYAVGVGAGQQQLGAELAFTTENTTGVDQRVLPTFATLFGPRLPPELLAELPAGSFVHAEEALVLHRPLAPAGEARTESAITAIHDKGSGALVVMRAEISDPRDGAALATLTRSTFLVGQGGFGGDRGPRADWALPDRQPDAEVADRLAPGQPLIYRLSGDRNPLHSDPEVARRAGYPAPLIHGLCVYGYAGRALLTACCDGDPGAFGAISGRFANPLPAGDVRLTVAVWRRTGGAVFQVRDGEDRVILDRGTFTARA